MVLYIGVSRAILLTRHLSLTFGGFHSAATGNRTPISGSTGQHSWPLKYSGWGEAGTRTPHPGSQPVSRPTEPHSPPGRSRTCTSVGTPGSQPGASTYSATGGWSDMSVSNRLPLVGSQERCQITPMSHGTGGGTRTHKPLVLSQRGLPISVTPARVGVPGVEPGSCRV